MIASLFSNFMINSSITEYTLYFQVPIFGIIFRPHPFSFWHEYTEQIFRQLRPTILYCARGNYDFIQQILHKIHNLTHTFTTLKCHYPDQRHCFIATSVSIVLITKFLTKLWNKLLHKTACLSWVSKPE